MLDALIRLRERFASGLERAAAVGPLLARITLGCVFATSGWGKLHDLPKVAEFFRSLGIPAPELQAPLVASIELACGALLLVGLATRPAALLLACTMVVALSTALREQIDGLSSLLGTQEFSYLATLVWLALAGPGPLSVDAWLVRGARQRRGGRAGRRSDPAHPAAPHPGEATP